MLNSGAAEPLAPESAELTSELFDTVLRERERYRAIFEMGPVAIYSCDSSGVIDKFNARAAELWGRSPELGDTDERFCGSHKLFLPDGTYMPHAECPMALVVDGKLPEARDQEVVIEHPDGSRVTVIVNIRPLIDGRGQRAGAINCFYDISDRKLLEEALRESHTSLEHTVEQRTTALRGLSARLLRAQDEERRRISREIHDGIGQHLVHLHWGLAKLRRGASSEDIEAFKDLSETVEKCLAETRTVSHLLHPPMLDEVGLASALDWYVRGFTERSGVKVSFEMPSDLQRLPQGLELLLFRIVQESLTNIHRHADSASADIKLEARLNEVLLEVRDHGKGLPAGMLQQFTSGIGGGVGLRSLRERVTEIGGSLEIESDSNGTLIRATVPIVEQPASA